MENIPLYLIVVDVQFILVIGPICQINFISTIKYCWIDISIIKIVSETATFFDYFQTLIKINSTFTAVFEPVFYPKRFFTIKFITIFLHSLISWFLKEIYVSEFSTI